MRRVALAVALACRSSRIGAAAPRRRRSRASRRRRILLGGTVPLSGEAAAFGSVGPGAKAYFDYVNAKGGVNGRKIDYRYYDDALQPGADRAS